jgi:hypothetical protein
MKNIRMVEVRVYRERRTKIVTPKKAKLKRAIKEVPETLIKGQAISLSVE